MIPWDMDPEKKRRLLIRAAQLIALFMLVFGWIMIFIFWNN